MITVLEQDCGRRDADMLIPRAVIYLQRSLINPPLPLVAHRPHVGNNAAAAGRRPNDIAGQLHLLGGAWHNSEFQ